MSDIWHTGQFVEHLGRRLARAGFLREFDWGEAELREAIERVLGLALSSQAKDPKSGRDAALVFLKAQVDDATVPKSERMEAARLLLEAGE